MADDDSPRNADFVGRVVKDAKNPPETRMLTGWLGAAADKGFRRLYTDAELSAYVDIPADAILYTEQIRDVQPSGGVFVWVKRDAELKQGGSASSRAARFLRGQVQQDYASGGGGQDPGSLERAGFRCVTQVPCGEPTGFTGQCTKQPEVGGAWPCITAIPFCAAPTGFTGQCTHQPWPNPTQYVGCTFLHCPTQDLTHIPQICNIVATGMPGCAVVDLPERKEGKEGGGSPAERPEVAITSLPGCGYTKIWGMCETHLLGCGETKNCPTLIPGCGWSKNPICTDLPGCGYTKQWGLCQQTQPPKCNVSVDIPCITQTETPQCQGFPGGLAAFGAPRPGARAITTEVLQCNPSAVDACPTRFGCETQPPTAFCTQPPFCPPERTVVPETCPPTWCGPNCQTPQPGCTELNCTQAGPQCPTYPNGDCTFFGCPATKATVCTQGGPQCPAGTQSGPHCPSQFGSGCPTDTALDCTFGCTQFGPSCPTVNVGCPDPNAAAARAAGQIGTGPAAITLWQCQLPTPATRCFICPPLYQSWLPWRCPVPSPFCPPITQSFRCGGPSVVDACPTRLCGGGGGLGGDPFAGGGGGGQGVAGRAAPGFGGQFGGQFGRTDAAFGGGCPPFFTAFENQCVLAPVTFELECPTNFPLCLPTSPPQCPRTVQGCPTSFPGCPPRSHAIQVCTAFGPQCPTPVAVLPTRFQGCTQFQANCPHPTIWTQIGPQCQGFARAAGPGQQEPTPATVCFICTQVPQYCPVAY